MLPDYPQSKAKWTKFYMEQMKRSMDRHSGIFGQIRSSMMHEGESDVVIRADGSVHEVVPKPVSRSALIPAESPAIEALNVQKILKSMDELGKEFAEAKTKMMFNAIEEATEKIGNRIGPKSDLEEQIFEMIDKLHIDFDKNRQPLWNTIIASPVAMKSLQDAFDRIKSIPELRDRMEMLILKKWEEFRDREALRKLVG